jgi:hypothetical protein
VYNQEQKKVLDTSPYLQHQQQLQQHRQPASRAVPPDPCEVHEVSRYNLPVAFSNTALPRCCPAVVCMVSEMLL